jgi:hypothetical protein
LIFIPDKYKIGRANETERHDYTKTETENYERQFDFEWQNDISKNGSNNIKKA